MQHIKNSRRGWGGGGGGPSIPLPLYDRGGMNLRLPPTVNCCKCTVAFSTFLSHNIHLLALSGLAETNNRFPYPFISTSTNELPTLSYT